MFVKFFNFTTLLLLFQISSTSTFIVLDINNENQPLVCQLFEEKKSFFPMKSITNPFNVKKIKFISDHRLITACPNKDKNPDRPAVLMETVYNERTCKESLVDQAITIPLGNEYKCGTDDEGLWQAAGYRVVLLKPFLNQNLNFGGIYYICHSASKGVLYTMHFIFPGKRVNPFETWKTQNKEWKIRRSKLITPDLMNHETTNEIQLQLVPFDDMIPTPWRFTTLFDFNFISTNERVKAALDKLDSYLRSYADTALVPLHIVSGVKTIPKTNTNEGIVWYWRMIANQKKEIIFMVADQEPKLHKVQCTSITQNKNYILNTINIPGLISCEVDKSLMNYFNVTLPQVMKAPFYNLE